MDYHSAQEDGDSAGVLGESSQQERKGGVGHAKADHDEADLMDA